MLKRIPSAAIVLAVIVVGRPAHAIPYESFIDVDDEGDLQDLLSSGEITQDTFDELLDLLENGVDLNEASREDLYALPNLTYDDVDAILAYRTTNHGAIKDPADLVTAGVLTQEKLLSIASFLIVKPPGTNPAALHGWVRVMTRMSYKDKLAPPVALRARFTAYRHLTAGLAATTTRLDIGDPVYDPNRDALIADPQSYQVHVPKAYLKYEDDDINVIGGSYRAGFGQRLVFDNTRHYTPNGLYVDDQLYYSADLTIDCKQSAGELLTSPCAGAAGARYVTPDWIWRDGLFGVAAGAKQLELQTGWLQMYGFASVSRRSIYQYELVDRRNCDDPHDDGDPNCGAPDVFVRPSGDPLTPTTKFAYETLPNVFQERLVGTNVTYFADRRNSLGVTAYGAEEVNLVKGMDLDTQEWSRYPYGAGGGAPARFGALGANFSFGRSWFDLFGEAALSFDTMPQPDPTLTKARGGGGPAGILRATVTRKREELELVARYYSTDYANPYARPISDPDEFDGQRARDEAGGRARYTRWGKNFQFRALADVWVTPSTNTPKLDTYVRTMVRTTEDLWVGLWERYQDKDLGRGGHDQCFEISYDVGPTGAPIPCGGRQLTTILRAHYIPNHQLSATLMLEHQLLDDNTKAEYMTTFRNDLAAWLIVLYKPSDDVRIRARARYLDTAIEDDTYLERSVSGLVDAAFRVRAKDILRVRMDTKYWLDQRMSTLERVPNPELTLWLSYEARL
jgi:hypothetical protein